MSTLAVSEKFTVVQLKQFIFSKWEDLVKEVPQHLLTDEEENVVPIATPQSANHIRLRDFKNGKQSGPLRDDRSLPLHPPPPPAILALTPLVRIIGRCLLGLADGRKLIVQVLPKEEAIAADDILLALRLAVYHGEEKALSPPMELPMQRSNTIKQLFEKVFALFPQLHEPLPEELVVAPAAEGEAAAEVDYTATVPEIK